MGSSKEASYLAIAEILEIGEHESKKKIAVLDAISRNDLSRMQEPSRSREPNVNLSEMFAPLLLMTEDTRAIRLTEVSEWVSLTVRSMPTEVEGEFEATTLSVGTDADGEELRLWCSFDGAKPSRGELATLRRLAEVDYVKPAEVLKPHLNSHAAALAVYDVGQGSLCALVDKHEHPLIFFDLGWPLLPLNAKSCPAIPNFDPFALDRDAEPAPMVLSHFDWDHWGYAWLKGRAIWDTTSRSWKNQVIYRQSALERPWLVRRPRLKKHNLGASHIHLIQKLRSTHLRDGTRALKIYPSRKWSIPYGPATIIRCSAAWSRRSGHSFLRNNEGLAVHIAKDGYRVLYCGDAEFGSIPGKYRVNLTGVVAPHHGGKINIRDIPAPDAGVTMAVSTYTGCYSNVPCPAVETAALALGWSWTMTETRTPCSRGAGCTRGNILLPLTPYRIQCGCGVVDANCLCLA